MQNVKANIEALNAAKLAVTSHCLCAKFIEEQDRFIVIFPRGFAVDAAQMRFASEGVTKTKALELLLNTMEKYWKKG